MKKMNCFNSNIFNVRNIRKKLMAAIAYLPAMLLFISFSLINTTSAFAAQPTIRTADNVDNSTAEAQAILQRLTLKEKIGQKLMLDFRYWCETKTKNCTQDFVALNPAIQQIMNQNHIGGVIVFANNLKTIPQITTLTHGFQQTMTANNKLPVFIAVDQEGGIVTRLPRDVSVTFPGNMAMAAAYLGNKKLSYSADAASIMAINLKAIGINVNFAPDVDVNVNPLNPIINVRSFSDDPELVAILGLEMSRGFQAQGIASTLKHFPGHGDTTTDSHIGLPVVNHTLEQAWAIDLYPFKNIIEQQTPDFIMTAHIQFPALDNSVIYADKTGENITTPATLSRKIQYDLLRKQLNYDGLIVTDALDMGAIAQNFDASNATIKAFQAGNDIALMPIAIYQAEDANKISDLIMQIETAVLNGSISLNELDQSVLRILKTKIKLGLLKPDQTSLDTKIANAEKTFADKSQRELENTITDDAVTLVQNNENVVPIKLAAGMRIHILTPWSEQGAGIAVEIARLQQTHRLPKNVQVSFAKMSETDLVAEKCAIDNADIVIVGNSTIQLSSLSSSDNFKTGFRASLLPAQTLKGSLVFPDMLAGDSTKIAGETLSLFSAQNASDLTDSQFAFQALQYAKSQKKKTIFLSLLAPYDLPNYKNVADVMLAGYNFYGYMTEGEKGYYRGPSMQALTRIIFGISSARAKLPINIPNPDNTTEIMYSRGFGLTTP